MDLSFLQPVYGSSAPVVSLYINVSRDAEDADHAIRVWWGQARAELIDRGADEETVQALDEVVGRSEGTPGPSGQVVFAAEGSILLDFLVSEPPQEYGTWVGKLPHPMLYLAQRGQIVPHVLAVVDSIGADISVVDAQGTRRSGRVEGDDHPTHKPRGGAEHHKQMQRAVDEQVTRNAKQVAEAVRKLVADGETELIAVAGEAQVRGEVVEQLPDGLRAKAVEMEGGSRAAGSEAAPTRSELRELLNERADEQVQSVADAYEEGRGKEDRVAEGLDSVVSALQRGQVETLLWNPGALEGGGTELWIGPSGEQLALTREELRNIGVEGPESERADAAIVRAAVQTSADLVIMPEEKVRLEHGIGALLRFSDPTLTD